MFIKVLLCFYLLDFHEKMRIKSFEKKPLLMKTNENVKAVILAAGKGTRMKSEKPKVLHEIFNKPLVSWVLSVCENAGSFENIVIVGHRGEMVSEFISKNHPKSVCVEQKEQLGTGHAVSMAKSALDAFSGCVLVLCGDTPLVTAESLKKFINFHYENNADVTVMSAILENPSGYGRVVRDSKDNVSEIVEQKDCTEVQKTINEINAGMYCINWQKIKNFFNELKNNNSQNEYYMTDIIKWGNEKGLKVSGYILENADETLGINSRAQLAEAFNTMNLRHLNKLMDEGVTIVSPENTQISPETEIGEDTIVFPNTFINGKNKIGKNCKIGPFAHLRGDCVIEDFVKIGNFVELKKSYVKSHTNISHLSYVGDAKVGANVNIGAGTITANYNSITKEKKQTIINDGASIGSNTVLVAPVELGENAFIAAGSVITKDVGANALGLTRSPQREIKDYVK